MICNIVVVKLSQIDYFLHRKYELNRLREVKAQLTEQGVTLFENSQDDLGSFESEIVDIFDAKDEKIEPDMALFITSDPRFLEKYRISANDRVYFIIY